MPPLILSVRGGIAILAVLMVVLGTGAATGGATECGFASPARAVPQARPGMGPNQFLWPRNAEGAFTFRPVSNSAGVPYNIPGSRDSTQYITQTIPGNQSGHELFMDVARLDGNDDWLFVAYNAGVQAWDLRNDPANPTRAAFRDGWLGHFDEFPAAGEVDTYVEAIDVVESTGTIFVGLVGRNGHGFSLWEWNGSNTFIQHCQVSQLTARQVELVTHDNRAYAFVGASDGTYVYDLNASVGGTCALRGRVGGTTDGTYVSVIEKDGGLFVATADGSVLSSDPLGVEIWEVDPTNPGAARRLFQGLDTNSRGVALFEIPGAVNRYFLGVVERSASLDFYDVEACLGHVGAGSCSLGPVLATQEVADIGKLYEFLDISSSTDGRTWGYYGFMTSPGLFGSKFEYLLDLTPLSNLNRHDATRFGATTLSEITDGGDTYNNTAPCTNSAEVDYWGDYQVANRYGLNFHAPRHGIFIGNKFYRAGYSILDIHEIVGSASSPSVTTTIDGDVASLWLDQTGRYSASTGGCSPSPGDWCWVVETDGNDPNDVYSHSPSLGSCSPSYTNPESFDYSCSPAAGQSRCSEGSAIVTAWNTSCGPFPPDLNDTSSVEITLKDPRVEIGELETGGTVFQECRVVDMSASLGGRGPVDWRWEANGVQLPGCLGSASGAADLATVNAECRWDTSGRIFSDGFESGDVGAWGSPRSEGGREAQRSSSSFEVSLVVLDDDTVLDTESTSITIEEIGVAAFVNPTSPFSVAVTWNAATIRAAAHDTSEWQWEVEDPENGQSQCSFDGSAVCATLETSTDTLNYSWSEGGTYRFGVSISNCRSGSTETGSGQVTVLDPPAPVIFSFRFNPVTAAEFCCGSSFSGFECRSGVPIDFEVQMITVAPYTFGFDWERTSQASAVFEDQAPESNVGGIYRFSHTFSDAGSARTVYPVVQVSNGPQSDEADFDTTNDAITILRVGETCGN